MDPRSRTKIAFVVERYGLDEAGEAGRRTRAMATAMAAKGHDVTVLTTCARYPGNWANEMLDGKSSLEDVNLVRFRLRDEPTRWLDRPARALARNSTAKRLVSKTAAPRCTGYRRYLDHLGSMFDAVFFTGDWDYLVTEGVGRVRNAVLCPPSTSDPMHEVGRVPDLFRAARAIALTDEGHHRLLRAAAKRDWPCPTYLIGAAPDPLPKLSLRMQRMRIVDGPFLLHVGLHGPATDQLIESFRFFREAHAKTLIETDDSETIPVRDLRLVLAGDFRSPHAPEIGIIGLGPVDDACRAVLLQRALGVVHPDPSNRMPTDLLVAWTEARPTLVHKGMDALAPVLDHVSTEYVYDSPRTFAASAAALVTGRGPRRVFGARACELAKRTFSAAKLVEALERCVRGVVGRASGQVIPIDSSV